LATWAGRALGVELGRALAVGVMIALSSTAVVMRLLADRTELDSIHGRNALGILLLQDIAVVPLIFLVTALAGEGSSSEFGWAMARALGTSLLLAGALFVLLKYVIPRLFRGKAMSTNRDLPVLLAMVTAVGCALGAHALGLSPVLGAFVGGMMLAESPFATQVRADLTPLKTLFVTLFFASIGMLINPGWVLENWRSVGALVAAIVFGKMIIVSTVALVFRSPIGHAVATGLCLAQLGEFSFVLLNISRSAGLISADLFDLMIAAIIVTLFVSPYLVAMAPRLAGVIGRRIRARIRIDAVEDEDGSSDHVVLVGFGPAGRSMAAALTKENTRILLIEMNPTLAAEADALGIGATIGDATRTDIWKHVGVERAKAVAVSIPDPTTTRQIIALVRSITPSVTIVTRARYSKYHNDLVAAGATSVVDEESEVGFRMASVLQETLKVKHSGASLVI
ncbi:MAG: sodium:proton exchanger, partial [Deltaproteobacteria bacterium]|nr:sodium:proton exchanger [Deltaproteobacteria bacterium]